MAGLLYLLPLSTPEALSSSVSFLPHKYNSCQRCPRQHAVPFLLPTHLPPAVHSQCCWCPPGPHSPSTTALAAAQCCLPHAQPPRSPWQAEQLQHCSSSVCNAKGNTTLRGTSVPGQKERKRGCIFRVKNAGFKQRGKISMFPVTEEAGRRQSPPHLAFLIPGN